LLKRLVGRGLAGANLFQEFFKTVKVHCFNVSLRAAPPQRRRLISEELLGACVADFDTVSAGR
jgi:hypothetical protein